MLNKNDMARVIIQALYNLDELPAKDNVHVKRQARKKKEILEEGYQKAHKILTDKVREQALERPASSSNQTPTATMKKRRS